MLKTTPGGRRDKIVITVATALTAVLLAACGGSNKPSSAGSAGAPHKALAASNFERFPACMRDHGVTNFPDPQVNGNSVTLRITPSISSSPAYRSAQAECAHLLPDGGQGLISLSPAQRRARTEGLVAFAVCMRQHGFPSFPDPTGQGRLTLEMIAQAGINLRQPAVLPAADACVPSSRGQITRADVARAVANPGGSS